LTSAISLDDARAQNAAVAGRKAAVLAELLAAGFPVPDGFVMPAGEDLPTMLADLPGCGPGDLADAERLQAGEILVAPLTTPAWTPLFRIAAGVVTDVGSAMSHASIVAREYGIPAVVGCGDATARLTVGQRVMVDGAAGTVTRADFRRAK